MVQYDAANPTEYFEMLEDDWRKEKLMQVREMILHSVPELKESIRYKMLNFGDGEDYLFALNAQKHYVSLYVGSIDKVDRSLLDGFNLGKGCIRIKKTNDLEKLVPFIALTVEKWRNGEDVSC